jgi:hypothetical protein
MTVVISYTFGTNIFVQDKQVLGIPQVFVTFSDNLRSVSVKGRDAQDVLDIAQRSYLDRNYKPGWDIESVQLVENKILEESYR